MAATSSRLRFRLTTRRLITTGAVLTGALSLAACGSSSSTSSTTPQAVTRGILAIVQNPPGAQGRSLILQKVVIPGNTPLAAHTHAGTQMATIVSGTLQYTVLENGSVDVLSPGSGSSQPTIIHTIAPHQTYNVTAGEAVIEPAGVAHSVRSVGSTPVVIYVASLFTNGAPLSIPFSGTPTHK